MPAKRTTVLLQAPNNASLERALGATKSLWDELIRKIEITHAPVAHAWQPARTSSVGSMLRLIRKQRTIVYLIPQKDYFLAAFVFGERATNAVRQSSLPAGVIAALDAARQYAEGRGLRLETRTPDNVATMLKLSAIKMAH